LVKVKGKIKVSFLVKVKVKLGKNNIIIFIFPNLVHLQVNKGYKRRSSLLI